MHRSIDALGCLCVKPSRMYRLSTVRMRTVWTLHEDERSCTCLTAPLSRDCHMQRRAFETVHFGRGVTGDCWRLHSGRGSPGNLFSVLTVFLVDAGDARITSTVRFYSTVLVMCAVKCVFCPLSFFFLFCCCALQVGTSLYDLMGICH